MKIKATIKKAESFIITIGKTECEPFTKESTWNGMACYKNKHGVIITIDDHNFIDDMFGGLFNGVETSEKELNIVMCSPCFIPG